MGRGAIFVVAYSVFLIGMFGLFIYLMGTVNPDKLDTGKNNITEPEQSLPIVLTYLNDLSKDQYPIRGPDGERLGYGLAKAYGPDQSEMDFKEYAALIPLYHHLRRTNGFVNSSDVRDVVPPPIPSVERAKTSTSTTSKTPRPMFFKKRTHENTSRVVKYSPVKGLRRSVKEMDINSEMEEQTSGIILKIMDDSGRPRIEIKLGQNGSFEGNKLRHYRSSGNKMKAVDVSVSNETETSTDDKKLNEKNTIIKIMPNNTVVVEDTNTVNEIPLNFIENYSNNSNFVDKFAGNYKEINLMVDNDSLNVPPIGRIGMLSLRMLIDNETRSIDKLLKTPVDVSKKVNDKKLGLDVFENIMKYNKTSESRNDTAKPTQALENNGRKDLQIL